MARIQKHFLAAYDAPNWLPNWRTQGAYCDHADDMWSWAWECLRRNPEYQADYAKYTDIPWFYAEGGKTPKRADRCPGDDAEMVYLHGSYPALQGETKGQYESRTGETPIPLEAHLLKKWGVLTLEDPAKAAAPAIGLDEQDSMPPYFVTSTELHTDCGPRGRFAREYEWMAGRLMLASWPREYDDFVHAFGVDIRYNIKDQLEELRLSLEEMQEEALSRGRDPNDCFGAALTKIHKRPNTKDAVIIRSDLRILDAVWSGESRRDIANELWGQPKTATKVDDGGAMEASSVKARDQAITNALKRMEPLIMQRGYLELMRWHCLAQHTSNKSKQAKKKQRAAV